MRKQYVITDPCYILPEEVWDACLNRCEVYSKDPIWSAMFDHEVEVALKDFVQGQAFVCTTGFGDWNNTLYGPNVDGTGAFFADAGMVCVCEYIGKVSGALGNLVSKGGAAIFEADGPIDVEFDESDSDWTVVYITDKEGNEWHTHIPDDDEEEDEEDSEEENDASEDGNW